MKDTLFEVTAITGRSLDESLPLEALENKNINVAPYAHNEDILLYFSRMVPDLEGFSSQCVSTKNQSTLRTEVKNKPSFLDSLAMFWEVLNTGAVSKVDTANMGWKPRERFAATGFVIPDASIVNFTVGDFYQLEEEEAENVYLDLYEHPDGYLMTADLFFDFARRFLEHSTSPELIVRELYDFGYHQDGNCIHRTYIPSLISEDVISYKMELRYLFFPYNGSWTGAGCKYGVTFRRSSTSPSHLTVEVSEGRAYFFRDPYGSWTTTWYDQYPFPNLVFQSQVRTQQAVSSLPTDKSAWFAELVQSCQIGIRTCVGALYHTQSRAYSNLSGKVSRNFESFVESPEFLPVIVELAKAPVNIGKSAVYDAMPVLKRVRLICRLVFGAYLAYIFAIKPALESVRDAFVSLVRVINETPGEASLVLSGDASVFGSLPVGLRNLLATVRSTPVARYEIRFRSQMKLVVKKNRAVEVLDALLSEAARFGVEPDPTYLWAAQPFSFVIDWFVPIGGLLRDAYQRYKLVGARNTTVGHSVMIRVVYSDGVVFHCFLRSDATDLFLDPPRDSWLTAPGAPVQVALPLAIVLLF